MWRRTSMPVFAITVLTVLGVGRWWSHGDPKLVAELVNRFGLRWDDLAHPGQWFRVLTSPYVQPDTDTTLLGLFSVFVIAEVTLGTKRTLRTFVATDAVSTLTVLVALRLAETFNASWASVIHIRDGGASSGTIGVVTTLLAQVQSVSGRRATLAALLVWLTFDAITSAELAGYQHLVASVVALLAIPRTRSDTGTSTAVDNPGPCSPDSMGDCQ